jgi:mono/diheme cytochrome c family protein
MNRRPKFARVVSLGTVSLALVSIGCFRNEGLIGDVDSTADAAAPWVPRTPSSMPPATDDAAVTAPPPAAGGGMPAPGVATASNGMPQPVLALLQGRCSGCHTYGQSDPAGWGSVLDVSRMIDADIIVPGDPAASRMIDRIAVAGDMPPKGARLSSDDVAMLKSWITALKRPPSGVQSDTDILDAIAIDQLSLRDRSSDYRYVSFAHLVGEGRTPEELDATRKVFVFILNSLSRRGAIVDAPTIDPQKSIMRLRLSDLGWSEALWDTLTSFYPYCIRSNAAAHEALYAQLRTEAPVVRGDWFLATATKPPVYDLLLDSARSVDDLAKRLGVDIDDDINHPGLAEPDNLLRVGMRRSGVALHNRLLERHLGAQGQSLWISYDFNSNQGTSDLMANPLGPKLRDRQNFVHTFENAGGEVIFTLPNGLQGYMLVNAVGTRIDAAPLEIVRDPRRRNAVVETGISCFGCHGSPGILRPRTTDDVPVYSDTHIADFLGRELDEIAATYPRVLRPDPFVNDARKYRAFSETVEGGGPPAQAEEYSDFVALVGQYESNLGFHGAAAEFNEEYASFRDRALANDFGNIALPRTATSPLVTRDNFVCVYRDLIAKVRPNAVFCAKTFDAAAVRNICAGTSTGTGSGAGTSSGTGGGRSRDAGAPAGETRDAGADARNCRRNSNGRLVCS